ncbi:Mu-like prophage major head subunit gpT family protein [Rhizobium halophytocola]|uniref:Phage major head subunit gpT-like protein n=1 Tax=Rhizobium halophytocola TaxID=735519 RepID=A0ABS4E415_9HYPH|nr:Mu-like prophage major head subunit gpT family protein [Rhizobium halophytocola]MBP1852691.1 phage major head subunit gpT-like protein [Rhizobium halophytocola]
MEITTHTLQSAFIGFNASFQAGLAEATSMYGRIATTVSSTTRSNEYGWLGKFPGFRKWVGDRVVNNLAKHGYTLTNESYENTIAVDRDDFDDDNLGIYGPMFRDLGATATVFPDTLIWPLLKNGFSELCYDGQPFFDLEHPVLDEKGKEILVANTDGGAGTPWFLLDTSRPLKPLIYQERRSFQNLVRMDKEDDPNVFNRKEYQYGLDGRCQVGFGFWQMGWGSRQTLDVAHYEAARLGLMSLKSDYGRPLAIMPKLLVVPPSLESAALKIINTQFIDGGNSNPWYHTAEILVVPWLA